MPFVEYDEAGAICSDCGRSFPSEETLSEHRRNTHPPSGEGPARRGPTDPVVCAVCGDRFRSVAALADHNRVAHTR